MDPSTICYNTAIKEFTKLKLILIQLFFLPFSSDFLFTHPLRTTIIYDDIYDIISLIKYNETYLAMLHMGCKMVINKSNSTSFIFDKV